MAAARPPARTDSPRARPGCCQGFRAGRGLWLRSREHLEYGHSNQSYFLAESKRLYKSCA
nr:MAG TPA: hypothetical protein [Caudoviricetes sp.]